MIIESFSWKLERNLSLERANSVVNNSFKIMKCAKTNKLGVSFTLKYHCAHAGAYVCVYVWSASLIAAETVMNTCRRGSVAVAVSVAVDVSVTSLSTTLSHFWVRRADSKYKRMNLLRQSRHTHRHAHMRTRTRTHRHTHTLKLSLGSDKAHCGAALSAALNAK